VTCEAASGRSCGSVGAAAGVRGSRCCCLARLPRPPLRAARRHQGGRRQTGSQRPCAR
jgi:hypothetical protein